MNRHKHISLRLHDYSPPILSLLKVILKYRLIQQTEEWKSMVSDEYAYRHVMRTPPHNYNTTASTLSKHDVISWKIQNFFCYYSAEKNATISSLAIFRNPLLPCVIRLDQRSSTGETCSLQGTFPILTGDITPYIAMKKTHFCDPIVWLFRKSNSVCVCRFVLFLTLIYASRNQLKTAG